MKANSSGTYLFLFKIFKFGLSVFEAPSNLPALDPLLVRIAI